MDPPSRPSVLGLLGLLAASLLLTFGLIALVAAFVTPTETAPDDAASYLARHGRRCLDAIPEVDVEPGPAWTARWRRLSEEDCTPGTWISRFREPGQNLRQYRLDEPPSPARDAPLILSSRAPLRSGHEAMVEAIGEFLGLYFDRPVELRDGGPLPPGAFAPERGVDGQYDADVILASLKHTCPDRAAACISATDGDLFVDSLAYVFGLGHFSRRVGIFSLHRLQAPVLDPATGTQRPPSVVDPLRRALKIAAHELGHEFGVAHCLHYRTCVMGGTNSLRESDAGSLLLCPLEHEKLRSTLGFQPRRRFSGLAAWAHRNGLHSEARYWEAMAKEYPVAPNAAGGGR